MLKCSEDTMGEREMFLVLAAMLFFSMTSLSVNNFCINNNETMMKSEFDYYAISLAESIIEEAKTRFFDAAVEGSTIPPLSSFPGAFTYPPSRKAGEYYPNFTDIDDYHGLILNINTPRTSYTVSVQVGYVTEANINTIVNYRTFYKKMTVTVTGPFISAGSIVLSHVFSYYDFGS